MRTTPALRFCRRALRRIARDTRRGRKVVVVFDIDNTLVDTRHRTLAALRAFAASDPALARLARVPLSQVRYDGAQTAQRLGLSVDEAARFDRFWQDFFWKPQSFVHDKAIVQTTRLARKAKAAGAEVYYLTGRVEALAAGTIAQVAALGLPDADAKHVLCKPAVGVHTGAFKHAELSRLRRAGHRIGWFVSDAKADLAAVADLAVPSVLVDFPVGPRDTRAISPRTPRLSPRLPRQ